jgi:hypothetical protein
MNAAYGSFEWLLYNVIHNSIFNKMWLTLQA